eukprot:756949-Hanusia_phi.AAC.2
MYPARQYLIRHELPPAGSERVDLVEEDDGGRCLPGLAEHRSHSLLGVSHVLAKQLGTLYRQEVESALGR